jgi:hypothetical protein
MSESGRKKNSRWTHLMKPRTILILGILLLLSPQLQAQGQFFLGVSGGASSTRLSGDIPEDGLYTSKAGFSVGVIAEYSLTRDIRLSLQPSYVRRGTGVAFDVGEVDPRDSLALTLDYLSIPLMARFLSPGGGWFINGGLDLGFLLDASLEDVNGGGTTDVRDFMNDLDLAMILGVGKTFPIHRFLLTLELRYGQSLINAGANDQLAAALGVPPRFRSTGFQLLVAVLYPL